MIGQPSASRLRDRPFVIFTVCQMFSMGGWIPVLALLAVYMRDHLGAGVLAATATITIIHVTSIGMSLFAGSIASRWGGRRIYMIAVAGMTVFAGLLSRIGEGWQVIALAPLAGVMVAFYWTAISTYVLQAVAPRRRGTGMGVSAFVMVLAPGISGPILTALGHEVGIWLTIAGGAALLAIAVSASVLLLPELPSPDAQLFRARGFVLSDYLRLLANRHNLVAAFVRMVSGISFGIFQLLSALVLLDLTGQLSAVGLFLTAGAVGGGASQVLVGALSDRIGRRNLLIVAKLSGIGAALLFWRAEFLPQLLFGSVLQSFAFAAFQTLITAVSGDLVARRDIPIVSGLQTSMFSMGMVIGVLSGGLLWQVDHRLPFLFAALWFVPAIISLFVLPGKTLDV